MEADCKVVYLIFFILLIIVDFFPRVVHDSYASFKVPPHLRIDHTKMFERFKPIRLEVMRLEIQTVSL